MDFISTIPPPSILLTSGLARIEVKASLTAKILAISQKNGAKIACG